GAVECFRAVTRLEPTNPEGYARLGDTLARAGQWADGVAALRRAVELRPDDPRGLYNLGLALGGGGQTAEAHELHRRALRLTPEQVRDEHLAWAARFGGPTPGPPKVPEPHDPDRRLRIGYLSADFRGHTVAGFIETLLRHHDRAKVEVFAYASVLRPDDTTEK